MKMKSKTTDYPVPLATIIDHPEIAKKIFLEERPHKDTFIGVAKLDGSFMADNVGEMYDSLQIGEKLLLSLEEGAKHSLPTLKVLRIDGSFVGYLQYSTAILPNFLISRGIEVWCYAEAKSFNGGLPEIGVSIYCENY